MSKWKYNPNDKIRKRKNRRVIRHQITEIKMSNFCQRCGIEDSEHPEIFDFDHQYNKKECVSNLIQHKLHEYVEESRGENFKIRFSVYSRVALN